MDDRSDAADSTAMLLGLRGYYGAAALAAARARPPAAVLLDLGMPRMDGFEFVRRLREVRRCERTVVVVVSGHTSEVCLRHARERGIRHYLFEPVDLTRLRALLKWLVVTPRRGPDPLDSGTGAARHCSHPYLIPAS